MEQILEYLAPKIANVIEDYYNTEPNDYSIKKIEIKSKQTYDNIEEIRIRVNKPIVLKTASKKTILKYIASKEDLLQTFQRVCEQSIYSYQKQICEGFITIKGGHRVGLTGSCVIEEGKIININYISSLNFRIAREKKNISKNVLKYIVLNNSISNTLIVSNPGCGKTTLLRDLARTISTGVRELDLEAKTCGVVDERGEIAAMYKGEPQNDLGLLSDVIENSTKAQGMKMLIRSMAPEVIICDEIGSREDIEAINYAICSGAKGIFTAHGDNFLELTLNDEMKKLIDKCIIETIIFLDDYKRGEVKEVYKLNINDKTYSISNKILY